MDIEEFAKFFLEGLGEQYLAHRSTPTQRKQVFGGQDRIIREVYDLVKSDCSGEQAKILGTVYRMAAETERSGLCPEPTDKFDCFVIPRKSLIPPRFK